MAPTISDGEKVARSKRYVSYIEDLMETTEAAGYELEMRKAKTAPGGIAYDDVRVTTTPTGDRLERAILNLIEFRESLARDHLMGLEQIDDFFDRIRKLKTEGGIIVRMHYFRGVDDDGIEHYGLDGPDYAELGDALGYSKTTVYRRRDDGYIELYENGLPKGFE